MGIQDQYLQSKMLKTYKIKCSNPECLQPNKKLGTCTLPIDYNSEKALYGYLCENCGNNFDKIAFEQGILVGDVLREEMEKFNKQIPG